MLLCFVLNLYFALTGQEQGPQEQLSKSICLQQLPRHWRTNKDPKMQSAVRSNSKGNERHTLNFVTKHWLSLDCLNTIRILFLASFYCQAAQTPSSTKAYAFILCILFHLLLLLPVCCSQGFYWNLQFLWVFSSSKNKEKGFHHNHFRAAMLYIPLLRITQPSTESLKLLVVGYCTFSCVGKHLIWVPFLLGPLS